MEKEQRREAKQHLVVLMHQGISWKEARATVGVHISRSTAYRWVQGVQSRGEAALLDGRHGHPTKLREAVLQWLVATCRANPQMPSREVQAALQEQFDIYVSIGHLNRVRGQLGIENHRGRSKKKQQTVSSPAFTPMARRRRSFAPRRRCEHIWFARSLRNCSVLLCSPGWFTSCSPFLFVASEPFADPALFGSGGSLTPLGLTRLHWRCSREASRAFACLRLFSYGAVSGRTCQVQWSRGIHGRSRQVDHSPVAVRSLCRD